MTPRLTNRVLWIASGVALFAATSLNAAEPAALNARSVVTQIVAHRGSSADRPENTLASARRAIEAGATAVEVDVRRTKDGALVLMHDAAVDHTTNGKGLLNALTLDELKRLDAGAWFGTDRNFAGEKVPTLAEVLEVCRGKVDVLLDLKEAGDDYARAVADAIKLRGEPKRTIVGVRSVQQAKQFRRLLPDSRQIGLIAEPNDIESYLAVGVETIRVWPKWLTDATLIDRVKFGGAKLHLNGTTGTPDDILPLLKHRPDSLSSDDPARLITTLASAPPASFAPPPQPPRTKIILDTDIGSSADDAFALGLAVGLPEFDLRAVTTVGSDAMDRAWIVCRFLSQSGRPLIPVAAGGEPAKPQPIDWQIQYRRHPAVIFNRSAKPRSYDAVELLKEKLLESPGEVTVVALGPLTNLAKLFEKHPATKPAIKRLVIMGGAIRSGYDGRAIKEAEWNVAGDVVAARTVLKAGVPITLVPLDATATVRLNAARREKLFAACSQITYQMQNLYELGTDTEPVLFDPVAVAAALGDKFLTFEELRLEIDDRGFTRPATVSDTPKVRVAVKSDGGQFLDWYVERLIAARPMILPRANKNFSTLIAQGKFPSRVHVFEDFQTEIEKRWWMTGAAQPGPNSGETVCRGVLTQDYDDLQGDTRTMYRAVVFNPVPGPPMGPRTRLSFRYRLEGTREMRVQLYSLSNGYHRYLTLKDLPEGRWESGTVDMTHLRRPDGSGGPLAEDERIDDIQFYVDPRAKLQIDNIVLYDEATENETRPFPRNFLYTGWFDTGKQGKEWPGDFDVLPHEAPLRWKFARSVMNPKTNLTWLRISLRGERPIAPTLSLDLRYRAKATDQVTVELANSKSGKVDSQSVPLRADGTWRRLSLHWSALPNLKDVGTCDELRFVLPSGSEMDVDDVLLYEPLAKKM